MVRAPEQARRRAQVHNQIGVAIIIAGCIGVFMWLGQSLVASHVADVDGAYARATVLGRDVAPGDPIAIRIVTGGGLKTVIQDVRVKLGATELTAGGSDKRIGYSIGSRESTEDDVRIETIIPESTPVDTVLEIRLAVDLEVAMGNGDRSFGTSSTTDVLTLDLYVRSASERTARIALDIGLAVLAWLAAAALCFAGARWRPVGDRGPKPKGAPVDDYAVKLMAYGAIIGVVVIGMIGDLVFVRTLQRITSSDSLPVVIAMLGAWVAALAVGVGLGLRARRAELRWWKARLRPVIGTPPITDAFRGAGSVLPPSLSRDVDAKPIAEVLAALAAAGFTHDRRVISRDGAPVARIAAKLRAVRPEQLALDVFEGYDALPLARALTGLYGPLEISSRYTPPTIVDPQ